MAKVQYVQNRPGAVIDGIEFGGLVEVEEGVELHPAFERVEVEMPPPPDMPKEEEE